MPKRPDPAFGSDPEGFFADWQIPPADPDPERSDGLCRGCLHTRHLGECPLCFCRVRPDGTQGVDPPVDNPEPPRGRHRREIPKSSKLQRLRKWTRRG